MTKMAAAGMIEKAAAGMIEKAAAGMIEKACWRGHWPVSSISETRIIWNITSPGYLNNNRPWSSV
jgi:hypothetical protein